MMNVAIVLAGGTGSRIGADIPKQFIMVEGKPIMIYALEALEENPFVDAAVLVCLENCLELSRYYCLQFAVTKAKWFVPGGADFTHSCINGMKALEGICKEEDNVLIVAADRPFISQREINEAITVCNKYGSGIPARNCALCMFVVGEDRTHSRNYQRENLVQIQSPWTFKYGLFKDALAHSQAGLLPESENYPVAMFAAAGNEVFFVPGDSDNIKITEKYDIPLMEYMLKERKKDE